MKHIIVTRVKKIILYPLIKCTRDENTMEVPMACIFYQQYIHDSLVDFSFSIFIIYVSIHQLLRQPK